MSVVSVMVNDSTTQKACGKNCVTKQNEMQNSRFDVFETKNGKSSNFLKIKNNISESGT